jgi:hypothetical protein
MTQASRNPNDKLGRLLEFIATGYIKSVKTTQDADGYNIAYTTTLVLLTDSPLKDVEDIIQASEVNKTSIRPKLIRREL